MSTEVRVEYKSDTKSVDIYTSGNIVQHKQYKGLLILVTNKPQGSGFSGVRISNYNNMQFGEHNTGWDAGSFKQFQGTITLEAK